jgi:tRNA threonylcarbamoyladenosine biosynthesis protein TsaB
VAAVNVLAIDTTGKVVTAALASGEALLGEVFVNSAQKTAVTLMPAIKNLLDSTYMAVSDLTHIACASGPGSFTGLRIGAATAKALADAADIPIIAVPTLDSLAYNAIDTRSIIVPIMDARKQQVYTAYYRRHRENDSLIRLSDYMAKNVNDILQELSEFKKPIIFLGDGVSTYKDVIINNGLGINHTFAAMPLILQRASSTARLAVKLALAGKMTNSECFAPFYLRQSQAEQQRES